MPGGDVPARGVDVVLRIVEEDVGAEGIEERALVAAAEEQRLVQAHAPLAQRADHALVRGCRARGDQRGADRRGLAGRKRGLQAVQRIEEAAERPAGQRLVRALALVRDGTRRCPSSRDMRSPSSPKITASPSKAMRNWSWRCAGALAGRMVAAATPCSSARRTDSGLADRNSCAPNGLM